MVARTYTNETEPQNDYYFMPGTQQNMNTNAGQVVPVYASPEKVKALQQLANMSAESLAILADLSRKPGIEQKLKSKLAFIKMYL